MTSTAVYLHSRLLPANHQDGGSLLQCQRRVRLLESVPCDLTNANSYVEGIVRGYRNTLLTSQNYSNLTQCETIDGMWLYEVERQL